jgi:protein transport protein SEC24
MIPLNYFLNFFYSFVSTSHLIACLYPRFYAIHTWDFNSGYAPVQLNLSSEHIDTKGVFLLEDGLLMWLWVGKNVSAELLNELFGVQTLDATVKKKKKKKILFFSSIDTPL